MLIVNVYRDGEVNPMPEGLALMVLAGAVHRPSRSVFTVIAETTNFVHARSADYDIMIKKED